MKYIHLLGIDGSGKTTLADHIAHALREQGLSVVRVHAWYRPFLLRPVKWVVRKLFMRGGDAQKDYPGTHPPEVLAAEVVRHLNGYTPPAYRQAA